MANDICLAQGYKTKKTDKVFKKKSKTSMFRKKQAK